METVLVRKRKPRSKGKRDINLKDIETIVVAHEHTEKELSEHFPKGWHYLPDKIYKELKTLHDEGRDYEKPPYPF
jgi:hypothetical protein